MPEYYLELNDGSGRFEKVDEHVFANRKYAVDSESEERYTHNYFSVENGVTTIEFQTVKPEALAVVCRVLGVNMSVGAVTRGFYDEPTHVNFRKGRYEWLYDVKSGQRWKKAA